jgi:hypothetical protein
MLEFFDITLENREKIVSLLNYSQNMGCEYCFANNFAWKRLANTKMAFFEDFYILCAFDTESGFPEFSFPTGKGNLKTAINEIIRTANSLDSPVMINSVEERYIEYINANYPDFFDISFNDSSSDYIYRRDLLANLTGKKFHSKRNHIAQFKKKYNWQYKPLSQADFDEIILLSTKIYNQKKGYTEKSEISEQFAINAFLENYNTLNLSGGVLYVDDKLIAFTIGEPINSETFGIHIEKADVDFHGSYAMINQCFAKTIPENYIYINREEDLGIDGLRKAKESYYPEFLLKKYSLKKE